MANVEIHELIITEGLQSSDVIAEQRERVGVYLTRKVTLDTLGLFINKLLNYSSDLHTTDKTIIGAINELDELRLPAMPSADGVYTLKLTITSGVPALEWIAE